MAAMEQDSGGSYTGLHQIGRGHASEVWLARDVVTPRQLVVVKMTTDWVSELNFVTGPEDFEARIATGQVAALHRPNVDEEDIAAFRKLLLPSEVCQFQRSGASAPRDALVYRDILGPTIHEYAMTCLDNRMPWSMGKIVLEDCMDALQYLHHHGIGHGDLHTRHMFLQHSPPLHEWPQERILAYAVERQQHIVSKHPADLSSYDVTPALSGTTRFTGHIMLGDFGSAFLVNETARAGGCVWHVEAPERLAWESAGGIAWTEGDTPPWSLPADVWALGSTMLEVVTGRRLFEVPRSADDKLEVGTRAMRDSVPDTDDPDMVQNTMAERLREAEVPELCEHRIRRLGELLAGMLRWRAEDRISIAQVQDTWQESCAL